MPILFAVFASLSPPISEANWAKTVLIDLLVASSKEIIPDVLSNLIDLLYSDLSWQGLNIYCFSFSKLIWIKFPCSSIFSKSVMILSSGSITSFSFASRYVIDSPSSVYWFRATPIARIFSSSSSNSSIFWANGNWSIKSLFLISSIWNPRHCNSIALSWADTLFINLSAVIEVP